MTLRLIPKGPQLRSQPRLFWARSSFSNCSTRLASRLLDCGPQVVGCSVQVHVIAGHRDGRMSGKFGDGCQADVIHGERLAECVPCPVESAIFRQADSLTETKESSVKGGGSPRIAVSVQEDKSRVTLLAANPLNQPPRNRVKDNKPRPPILPRSGRLVLGHQRTLPGGVDVLPFQGHRFAGTHPAQSQAEQDAAERGGHASEDGAEFSIGHRSATVAGWVTDAVEWVAVNEPHSSGPNERPANQGGYSHSRPITFPFRPVGHPEDKVGGPHGVDVAVAEVSCNPSKNTSAFVFRSLDYWPGVGQVDGQDVRDGGRVGDMSVGVFAQGSGSRGNIATDGLARRVAVTSRPGAFPKVRGECLSKVNSVSCDCQRKTPRLPNDVQEGPTADRKRGRGLKRLRARPAHPRVYPREDVYGRHRWAGRDFSTRGTIMEDERDGWEPIPQWQEVIIMAVYLGITGGFFWLAAWVLL